MCKSQQDARVRGQTQPRIYIESDNSTYSMYDRSSCSSKTANTTHAIRKITLIRPPSNIEETNIPCCENHAVLVQCAN